jgi:cbb3-type cytochrome oxidase maturation protein
MNIFFLIPLSLGLGLIGLASFAWALRTGQFDDPEGDAWRILPIPPAAKGETDDDLASQPDHRDARRGL